MMIKTARVSVCNGLRIRFVDYLGEGCVPGQQDGSIRVINERQHCVF